MSVDIVGWEIFRTTNLPVVGAAVNVRAATAGQPNTSGIITAMNTNANGQYSFTGLADGDYDIDITYAGVTKSYKGLTKFNGIVQPSNFQSVSQGYVLAGPASGSGRPTFRAPAITDFGAAFGPNFVLASPDGSTGPVTFRKVVGLDFSGQAQNTVLASPTGGGGTPGFRAVVPGDFGALGVANQVIASPNGSGGAAAFRNIVGNDFGPTVGQYTVLAGSAGAGTAAPQFRGLTLLDIPSVHQMSSVYGAASNPTSAATTSTLIPEMSAGLGTISGSYVYVFGIVGWQHDSVGQQVRWMVSRDGVDVILGTPHVKTANYQELAIFMYRWGPEDGGAHTYQLRFSLTAGTITFTGTYRGMHLIEVRR